MTRSLTVFDVAEALQIAPKTARKLAAGGKLRGFRVARQWRFELAAIAQFKARATHTPTPVTTASIPARPSKPVTLNVRRRFV